MVNLVNVPKPCIGWCRLATLGLPKGLAKQLEPLQTLTVLAVLVVLLRANRTELERRNAEEFAETEGRANGKAGRGSEVLAAVARANSA